MAAWMAPHYCHNQSKWYRHISSGMPMSILSKDFQDSSITHTPQIIQTTVFQICLTHHFWPPNSEFFHGATVILILGHCQAFSSKRTYNMGIQIISRAFMSDETLWRDESERTSQESRTHHKTSSSGILLAKPRHWLLSLFKTNLINNLVLIQQSE